jgi:hypothetical protein
MVCDSVLSQLKLAKHAPRYENTFLDADARKQWCHASIRANSRTYTDRQTNWHGLGVLE